MGITVVGSLNYDLVTYTDRLPFAGETFRANSFETHAGGKGLNQTIAIAKLQQTGSSYSVRMVGNVGDDAFGQPLLDLLSVHKVDVDAVRTIAGQSTGVATIIVEEKMGGQNRILLSEGANGSTVYTSEELCGIFSNIEHRDVRDGKHFVVLQHEIPDPCSIMSWLRKNYPDFQVVFNPSPCKPLAREEWKNVDVLIINEIEALQIVEAVYSKEVYEEYKSLVGESFIDGYRKICQEFQQHLVGETHDAAVVVTLGSQGALYCSKSHKSVGYVPSLKVEKVVDTTGAGDTFLGSLVTQLYLGVPLEDAVKFSTKASSLTIQRKGAAESIPTYSEVVKLL